MLLVPQSGRCSFPLEFHPLAKNTKKIEVNSAQIFMKFLCNQSDLTSNTSTKLHQHWTHSNQDRSHESGTHIHIQIKFGGATVNQTDDKNIKLNNVVMSNQNFHYSQPIALIKHKQDRL